MTPENEKKLYKKYPKLFSERNKSRRETAFYGIACGDGWFWLIDQLCSSIQSYIDNSPRDQTVVAQLKEKFGGLRFYVNYSDTNISGMIWLAEEMSYNICEVCGSTKDVSSTTGWVKVRCKTCMDKEEKLKNGN